MTGYYHGIFQDECQTCNIDQINDTLKFNVNYLINCNVLEQKLISPYYKKLRYYHQIVKEECG